MAHIAATNNPLQAFRRRQMQQQIKTGAGITLAAAIIATVLIFQGLKVRAIAQVQNQPLHQGTGTMRGFLSQPHTGSVYFASIDGYPGTYPLTWTPSQPPPQGQRLTIWYQVSPNGALFIDHITPLP